MNLFVGIGSKDGIVVNPKTIGQEFFDMALFIH